MSNAINFVIEFITVPTTARTIAILVLLAAAPFALLSSVADSLASK